nr:putative expansin-B14 [Ipomoea batatas]GMD79420.1 putative expansin-B14 [Ipomoea batatas]GMD81763.1 putative expansin-B14 [Ipomoea batatas]GMD98500.1 putative expansin-B14 [Ipomoea batatas]GME20255.1 putative expansin-B14 [Ipomoea batatas]
MASSHCIMLIVFLFLINNYCYCINPFNSTLARYAPAIATWYGPPNGHGTDTGACGFGNVGKPPYHSLIAAGNQALFKRGKGCGQCYLVKCTSNRFCSRKPIKIRITDECPGACNNLPVWFDLSGIAFGAMAKPGQANAMRNVGRVQISYRHVKC